MRILTLLNQAREIDSPLVKVPLNGNSVNSWKHCFSCLFLADFKMLFVVYPFRLVSSFLDWNLLLPPLSIYQSRLVNAILVF